MYVAGTHRHRWPLIVAAGMEQGNSQVELSAMHVVGTLALLIGLAVLLLLGFLDVAHDLLSRNILESSSCANEEALARIAHQSSGGPDAPAGDWNS